MVLRNLCHYLHLHRLPAYTRNGKLPRFERSNHICTVVALHFYHAVFGRTARAAGRAQLLAKQSKFWRI